MVSSEPGVLRLPVATEVDCAAVVLFRPLDLLPSQKQLRAVIGSWLDLHCAGPLRAPARAIAESSLRVEVRPRAQLPLASEELLLAQRPLEDDAARLRAATYGVLLVAREPNAGLRPAHWTVVGAARAVAMHLGGVVFDPMSTRLVPSTRLELGVPDEGLLAVARHILVPWSLGDDGLVWMTTQGMGRFGLPELQVVGAPPNLASALQWLVNGVAQTLVHRLLVATEGTGGPVDHLDVEENLPVDATAVAASAAGREPPSGSSTVVRLRFTPELAGRARASRAVVTLRPPAGAEQDMGRWLARALRELLGTPEEEVRYTSTSAERMQEAHHRAVSELPVVRARYRLGLPVGQTLYVKHGFDLPGGGTEYMWLVVTSWRHGRIAGRLTGDAHGRDDLRAGTAVEIDESQVFDWLMQHAGGDDEGGYTTTAVLESASGPATFTAGAGEGAGDAPDATPAGEPLRDAGGIRGLLRRRRASHVGR